MKTIFATIALLAAFAANAQQKEYSNVAYWSGNGQSLVLLKDACDIQGMPANAKKATYMAYMTMANGCYMVTGPETVLVSIPGHGSREMTRVQFRQWDIK